MKVKSASAKNFAKFETISVNFDPNITYLVGKNGAGKSTVGLGIIWAAMQGIAQKSQDGNIPFLGERFRFVGPYGQSAEVKLTLTDERNNNAEIVITRRITKSGGTAVHFAVPEGYPEALDQAWLNNLFNEFLIAPKRFLELTSKQQALVLGIDTADHDRKIATAKEEITNIGRDIKQLGTPDPVEETTRVDIQDLLQQKKAEQDRITEELKTVRQNNAKLRADYTTALAEFSDLHATFRRQQMDREQNLEVAKGHLAFLQAMGYTGQGVVDFLKRYQELTEKTEFNMVRPEEPEYAPEDLSSNLVYLLDQQIAEASATNERAIRYEQYKTQVEKIQALNQKLSDSKAAVETLLQDRTSYIREKKLPFKNMSINESGELLLDSKPIREPYFSTGELMRNVPLMLVQQNPEFKYVFLQDFYAMDEDKQRETIDYLTGKGFQLVIEKVGKEKAPQFSILLKDQKVVESYDEIMDDQTPQL